MMTFFKDKIQIIKNGEFNSNHTFLIPIYEKTLKQVFRAINSVLANKFNLILIYKNSLNINYDSKFNQFPNVTIIKILDTTLNKNSAVFLASYFNKTKFLSILDADDYLTKKAYKKIDFLDEEIDIFRTRFFMKWKIFKIYAHWWKNTWTSSSMIFKNQILKDSFKLFVSQLIFFDLNHPQDLILYLLLQKNFDYKLITKDIKKSFLVWVLSQNGIFRKNKSKSNIEMSQKSINDFYSTFDNDFLKNELHFIMFEKSINNLALKQNIKNNESKTS